MAHIEKRGNTYRVKVFCGYDSFGKQLVQSTTFVPDPQRTEKQNQRALQNFAYEFEQRVISGKYLNGEKLTLAEFTARWFAEYADKQLEASSLAMYQRVMNQLVIPKLGHLKIAKITPLHITAFYNDLAKDGSRLDGKAGGYSATSIQKFSVILSSVFSTAVQWMIISENPCAHATKPKKNRAISDVKHFTPEQTKIFLDALDAEYEHTYKAHNRIDDTGKEYHVNEYKELRSVDLQFKVFFYIALFGGLRRSEILALTWRDIDFSEKTVTISKSVCYVNGTRSIKQPKTRNSVRTVTMPNSLMSVLKKYQIEQMSVSLALGDEWNNPDGYLFTQWNGKPMDVTTPYHKFKHIIADHNASILSNDKLTDEEKAAQLLPDIPLHGLRHTSATLLIADNKDVITVANRLGHAQPSTTMNIYAHALKKKDEEASDTFERVFGSRKQSESERLA